MSNQDSGNPAAKPPKGKTAARRKARSLAVQALYSWQIAGQPLHEIEAQFRTDNDFSEVDGAYFHEILHGVPRQKSELDSTFEPCLDRPLAEIDPVELAILRLSTYELRNRIDVPYKVVINEGIELAKTFGATDGHKFVNGVLDKLAPRLRAARRPPRWPNRCWRATGRRPRNSVWASPCAARPALPWTSPTGCSPTAGISPALPASPCWSNASACRQAPR
ncbi:transcription antitermination protein NusB [Pseudomonas aeruginosa VRFPA03]|nr:transcription antitermination protein NusB [Pseudomonas aeruginosa VRFPA03]